MISETLYLKQWFENWKSPTKTGTYINFPVSEVLQMAPLKHESDEVVSMIDENSWNFLFR